MSEQQFNAMRRALVWTLGILNKDEREGIKRLAKDPSLSGKDGERLVSAVLLISSADPSQMDRTAKEEAHAEIRRLLRVYGYVCITRTCGEVGYFSEAYCHACLT